MNTLKRPVDDYCRIRVVSGAISALLPGNDCKFQLTFSAQNISDVDLTTSHSLMISLNLPSISSMTASRPWVGTTFMEVGGNLTNS
jgi:hypothetical protein